MRLRSWPFVVVVLVVLMGLSGCSSNSPASPISRGSPAPSATAAPPTPSATVATGGVTVVATGAAASPTCTLVFVVVTNTNPGAASGVAINATAASANGGAPLHASTVIAALAPGESQAARNPADRALRRLARRHHGVRASGRTIDLHQPTGGDRGAVHRRSDQSVDLRVRGWHHLGSPCRGRRGVLGGLEDRRGSDQWGRDSGRGCRPHSDHAGGFDSRPRLL